MSSPVPYPLLSYILRPSLSFLPPGVLGGKFLERGRVKKPGQELFKSEMSEYFSAQDLYVGARLSLNNQAFQLVDADEYAFNYMEQHAEEVGNSRVSELSFLLSLLSSLLFSLLLSSPCSSFFLLISCHTSKCSLLNHEVQRSY